jgi:hypothetical protein
MKDYQVVKNESAVYLAEVIPQNLQPHAQVAFSDPRPMLQVVRVGEGVCSLMSVFVQSERWRCHYWSADVAAAFA